MWGKLACEILLTKWDQVLEDINALKDAIEARVTTSALAQMQQRCWLMHWSLFVLGNHPNGRHVVVRRSCDSPHACVILRMSYLHTRGCRRICSSKTDI